MAAAALGRGKARDVAILQRIAVLEEREQQGVEQVRRPLDVRAAAREGKAHDVSDCAISRSAMAPELT